jgi:hypothetical protein
MSFTPASLIKETTATIGTGDITLAGAEPDFFTFASKMTPGSFCYVPYVIRLGAEYEIGVGRLSTSTTLQRVKVYESSNANALVNFASGTKEVYCATGGKNPLGAVVTTAFDNPHGGYSMSGGFQPNSLFYGSNSKDLWYAYLENEASNTLSFMLLASPKITRVVQGSTQTAVIAVNAINPVVTGNNSTNAVIFGEECEVAQSTAFGFANTAVFGQYAKGHQRESIVLGSKHTGQTARGVHQVTEYVFCARTTDGFALECVPGRLHFPANSITRLRVTCIAKQNASAEYKALEYLATYHSTGSAVNALGSPSWTTLGNSAGAAAWTAALNSTAQPTDLGFFVTGESAKTINWTLFVEATLVTDSAA